MYAKLINNQLDYFKQPDYILGDATAHAIEQGYKEVTYSAYPELETNQYTREVYTETENQIVVNYEVFTSEVTPEPTLEEVIQELIQKLNEKNIIP